MLEADLSRFRTKRIALWAVPRSVSSAFERAFIERQETQVLHEPFSYAYYHGPERRSDRFAEVEPKPEHAYEAVVRRVLETDDAPILFVKDMAYQVMPTAEPALLQQLTNTFLIRHPREALASFHRMWPDFTEEEAGYGAQARLFDLVTDDLGQPPVVVDATDLRREPEAVMRAYCEAVGVPFFEGAMTWESGPVDEFEPWQEWHLDVEASTRIAPPDERSAEPLPARVERLVEHALPHYQRLFRYRLRA